MTLTILIALCSLMPGCGGYKKFTPDELKGKEEYSKEKIIAVILSKEIAGVKLTSDEEIYFDESGGIVDRKLRTISGITKDGSQIEFDVNELHSILVKITTNQGPLISETDIKSFKFYAMEYPWKIIDGRCVANGEVVVFDKKYGTFDFEREVIFGTTKLGLDIEIPFNSVNRIKIKKIHRPFNGKRKGMIIGAGFGTFDLPSDDDSNPMTTHIKLGIGLSERNVVVLDLARYGEEHPANYIAINGDTTWLSNKKTKDFYKSFRFVSWYHYLNSSSTTWFVGAGIGKYDPSYLSDAIFEPPLSFMISGGYEYRHFEAKLYLLYLNLDSYGTDYRRVRFGIMVGATAF